MRQTVNYTILDDADSTGAGKSIFVDDFQHAEIAFDSASSANLTVKFQGSFADDAPTWGSAQSVSNQWDYLQIIDLENGAIIDGDTGISLVGTDDHRQFEINTSGLRWLTAIVTARSAGSVTVKIKLYSNG